MTENYNIDSLEKLENSFKTACVVGDVDFIQYLIEHPTYKEHIVPDKINDGFLLACENDCLDVIEYFLSSEIKIYFVYQNWQAAILAATTKGSLDAIKFILEHIKGKRHVRVDYDEIFKVACICNHVNVLEFLFSQEIDNIPDVHYENDVSFLKACYYGNMDVVKFLLESDLIKSKIDIHTNNDSAIIYACMGKRNDMVEYLLSSPFIKEHSSVYIQDCMPFVYLCEKEMYELISSLIVNNKLILNEKIKVYLQKNNRRVLELFMKKEFASDLESKLSKKEEETSSGKTKI